MNIRLRTLIMLPLAAFFLASANTVYAQNELTGDTRLACEAVLCLSSSTQPGECAPSLARYFGIKFDKPWETIKARIDFLSMCPAHNEPGMSSLIVAIANGAGKCDSAFLNRFNKIEMVRKECKKVGWYDHDQSCTTTQVELISNKNPDYCLVYENHEYTDLNTGYVGDMLTGGRWADVDEYDQALQRYKDNYQPIPRGVTYSPLNDGKSENDS